MNALAAGRVDYEIREGEREAKEKIKLNGHFPVSSILIPKPPLGLRSPIKLILCRSTLIAVALVAAVWPLGESLIALPAGYLPMLSIA